MLQIDDRSPNCQLRSLPSDTRAACGFARVPQLAQRLRFDLTDALSALTAKLCPTSSRVCSLPSPTPEAHLEDLFFRGVSVFSTDSVCSLRFRLMTASAGETTWRSSMKSPRCESSSSPIGVSSEIGSCAIFRPCGPC
jgi:hypothetical protein